jgi:hypothetical protein
VAGSFSSGQYIGINQSGLAYYTNSTVLQSGGTQATYAAYASGTRVCMALDLIAAKMWWRPGIAANWNNAAIGSQNPAVGSQVGGLAIPAGLLSDSSVITPAYTFNTVADTAVASFAQSSWLGTAPTGFGPFDPPFGAMVM